MIHMVKGNIFETDAQAIVNPVNCVGVMGAGLAARFKSFYPDMFEEYKQKCSSKWLRPGRVHVWKMPNTDRYIINFPTKTHWKEPSTMNYVNAGVGALITTMKVKNIHSVAIPALGCGLGGLQWEPVRDAIIAQFQQRAPDDIVFLYEPKTAVSST